MPSQRKWQLLPRRAKWTREPDLARVASWLVDKEAYKEARWSYIEDYLDYRSVTEFVSEEELYGHAVLIAQLMERDLPEFIEAFFQYSQVAGKGSSRRELISSIQETIVSIVSNG